MPMIRASSVPRVLKCPASKPTLDDGPVIDVSGHDATIGTVVHHALAMHVKDGLPGPECIESACNEYCVDESEVRALFYAGARIYAERLSSMTVLDVEGQYETVIDHEWMLTGHWDVLGELNADGKRVWAVADWKTGNESSGQWDQIRAYLILARAKAMNDGLDVDHFKGILVWLREGTIEIRDFQAEELERFRKMLCAALGSRTYSPGDNCQYCPQKTSCYAYKDYMRGSAETMLATKESGAILSPQDLAKLYGRTRLLKKALEDYESALRLSIAEHGPLSTGDGRMLYLEKREKVSLLPRLDILQDHDIRAEDVVEIKKSRLLDAAASVAPRGQKGAAKQTILDAFEAAGAVSKTTYTTLAARQEGTNV